MSGGDLHAFLRSCRRNSLEPSIRMIDLLSMMIDVCRAAAYLEANKHVHRDLAARNCLISSKRSQNRVTKISKFLFKCIAMQASIPTNLFQAILEWQEKCIKVIIID